MYQSCVPISNSINILQEKDINQQQRATNLIFHEQEQNEQYLWKDSKFIWNRQTTFALLSAYEARNIETDNTKKNKKFWQSIAQDLNDLGLSEVLLTGDQVRWKFSALKKSYNKKKDHNRTSGNAPKIYDDYEKRLQEILDNKSGNSESNYVFNSPISINTQNRTVNEEYVRESSDIQEDTELTTEGAEIRTVQQKKRHGTGSKTSRTKLELEKQWLEHLQFIQKKYEDKNNYEENENKRKVEELEFKKEKFAFKKKRMLFEELKLNKKTEQHKEKMAIQREKCDLLRGLIEKQSIFH